MKRVVNFIVIATFAIGILVRLADVARPIDRSSWRESDVGAVARNFAAESMNIFYPRIDWRGTTPGFAEMEFPLYPFLIAITYKAFGTHDVFGRIWAFLFSIVSLGLFFRLAREYLDGIPLAGAFAFFTFNPLIFEFSTSIQPEGLMLVFYLAAALYFIRWVRTDSEADYWAATAATALALLAKLTAAHLGLLFAVLILREFGIGAVRRRRIWVFGILSVLPAALWHLHAKGFWRTYGNSLGVSNEHHWIGADFFTNSYFVRGILANEMIWVWSVFGIALAAAAIVRGIGYRAVLEPVVWLAACGVLYVATARTTADDWAGYYHIFSIAPAALLFGSGIGTALSTARGFAERFSSSSGLARILKLVLVSALAVCAALVFALDARQIRARILENRLPDPSFACAREIAPELARPGLILVSGDRCFDPDGYEVAYNASFMFYWLERKGSNICVEHQSLANVRVFAAAGDQYFVAQRHYLRLRPGFEDDLRRNFRVVTECGDFVVFDLDRK